MVLRQGRPAVGRSVLQGHRQLHPDLADLAAVQRLGPAAGLLDGLGVSAGDTFLFSQPVNTEGGPLKGIEVSYQQPFSFLPGLLKHTGAIFNVTVVDSKIDYISARSPTGFVQNDLVGLSKNAFNATLYYEDERSALASRRPIATST
jgi:hypothetical protein